MSSSGFQRLGKNANGYFGEKLDLSEVLLDCRTAAAENGWTIQELPAHPKPNLLALTRVGKHSRAQPRRYYISTGIHGAEPAGPLAVRQLLRENGAESVSNDHLFLARAFYTFPFSYLAGLRFTESVAELKTGRQILLSLSGG